MYIHYILYTYIHIYIYDAYQTSIALETQPITAAVFFFFSGLLEPKELAQLKEKLLRNSQAHQRYLDHALAGAEQPERALMMPITGPSDGNGAGGNTGGGAGGGGGGANPGGSGGGGGGAPIGGLRSVLSFGRRTRSSYASGTPPKQSVV